MNRKEAMEIICNKINNEIIISANGFISRDLFSTFDRDSNFYMIGSMGLASSIVLGIAIKSPRKRIFVFDGDGNILMNLGSLITIGSIQPKNFVHIIFDNHVHESTGGQPTTSNKIKIGTIAEKANYKVFNVKTKKQLEKVFEKSKKQKKPVLISINISRTKNNSGRVELPPVKIKNRFMKSISNQK